MQHLVHSAITKQTCNHIHTNFTPVLPPGKIAISVSGPLALLSENMPHPQNQKYTMYSIVVARRPSHGHR